MEKEPVTHFNLPARPEPYPGREESKMVDKVKQWMDRGFDYDEAAAMVRGSTQAECYRRFGGVWQVGNVSYYQAVSAAHAEKMYKYRFKVDMRARFVPAPRR